MTRLKPRPGVVTLFQGDDFDRERDLRAAVENAVTSGPRRMNDPDAAIEAADAYDAFVSEAAERGVKVPLLMLPRSAWREMVAKHPPRADDDGDETWGFNYLTLADDLVPASIDMDPNPDFGAEKFASLGDRDEFLDSLGDADFTKIYIEALNLNQAAGPNPKVKLSSLLARTSGETSMQPQPQA